MIYTIRTFSILLAAVTALLPHLGSAQEDLFTMSPRLTTPLGVEERTLVELPPPVAEKDSVVPWDFSHADLSALDLSERFQFLLRVNFDSRTVWSEQLPQYFKPEVIDVFSRDPGLGIRQAAIDGYTAQGAGIAIIGPVLLPQHDEYSHKLRHYEHIGAAGDTASRDGTAWASMTVGKTTGIAFDAWLYYFAVPTAQGGGHVRYDNSALRTALSKLSTLQDSLPSAEKISAVALPYLFEQGEVDDELEELKARGITVFRYEDPMELADIPVFGLGRDPLRNPQDYLFLRPAKYWGPDFQSILEADSPQLFIPLESRMLASPAGKLDYAFYRYPHPRYVVPFLAACYVMLEHAFPGLTKEEFVRTLIKSAPPTEVESSLGFLRFNTIPSIREAARLLRNRR
ncbi:MAG: hypothetical protein CL946_08855 [Ectothiorhodospiraceae bacterium]|nr:hypothetical protein [Ectothiorhodospiraceae bacterium]